MESDDFGSHPRVRTRVIEVQEHPCRAMRCFRSAQSHRPLLGVTPHMSNCNWPASREGRWKMGGGGACHETISTHVVAAAAWSTRPNVILDHLWALRCSAWQTHCPCNTRDTLETLQPHPFSDPSLDLCRQGTHCTCRTAHSAPPAPCWPPTPQSRSSQRCPVVGHARVLAPFRWPEGAGRAQHPIHPMRCVHVGCRSECGHEC